MEKGEISVRIYGPKVEMIALAEQLEADQPFEEMEIELDTDSPASVYIHAGYARGTDDMVETWKKENPHWDINCDMHIYGWGPQSLHHFDNKEWHDYDFSEENIDLYNMDVICENLVGSFGLEDYIEELKEAE